MRTARPRLPRQEDDFYPTPEAGILPLLRVERFPHLIHEPACGDGAISEVLKREGYGVVSTDLNDYGYGTPGRDFLAEEKRPSGADALVTNPPFRHAEAFALHALHLGYSHIALFARLAWLEGGKRHERLWSQHPPSRVWIFSSRLTVWRGDESNPGKGGTMAFAWFIWRRGHAGTQVGWL